MLHSLTGFDHLLIQVPDFAEAQRAFARLGFAVEGERIALGAMSLRLRQAEGKAQFAALAFASTDPEVSRAAFRPLPGFEASILPLSPPRLGDHGNSAQAVASITVLLDNPEAAMPAYDHLFGAFAATPTDDMVTVHGGGPLLFLSDEDSFDHLHSSLAVRLPPAPAIAAIAVAVGDLARAEALLKEQGVRYSSLGGSLAIRPEDCLGLGLELVAG